MELIIPLRRDLYNVEISEVKKMTKMTKQKRYDMYDEYVKIPSSGVLLSLLITGGGSLYARQYVSAIIQFLVAVALWSVLMGWIMWINSPIIAYHDVKTYNRRLALRYDIPEEDM